MDNKRWPSKDPNDILDFSVNWADTLATTPGDTIQEVEWLVPDALTKGTASIQGTKAVIWLSGGVVGFVYEVTCRMTTVAGRQWDKTTELEIEEH